MGADDEGQKHMNTYWITFTDGTKASCQGFTANHARRIAEKLEGKTVALREGVEKPNHYDSKAADFQIKPLPYPATPAIWKFDDPLYGAAPNFCHSPNKCAGSTACPQNRSCTE